MEMTIMPARLKTYENGRANKMSNEDRSAHAWYRFVLSFPPHLVRDYLGRFGVGASANVLDPFCGTGTTLVECKKLGISSFGIEANPMAHFASSVKTNWSISVPSLLKHSQAVASEALRRLSLDSISDEPNSMNLHKRPLRTISPDRMKLLLTDSISPLPLHKTLVLLESLRANQRKELDGHERLALASAMVSSISNLRFGPEVGVASPKQDASVVGAWLSGIGAMASGLRELQDGRDVHSAVYHADSRNLTSVIAPRSIDAVITSPPYPNEKDYTRTTRLESVLLEFINSKQELRALKKGLVRSNTRSVYKEDRDDELVRGNERIQKIALDIERRRNELGKTSGFERMYHRVVKLYFGGMARHLADMRAVLRPGAKLAYVVGDQASYLRVMIRTGQLLAEIADGLGYKVIGIDLFRTRLSTVTGDQLREEVVVLRWPG